jgi:hypothetical protein
LLWLWLLLAPGLSPVPDSLRPGGLSGDGGALRAQQATDSFQAEEE